MRKFKLTVVMILVFAMVLAGCSSNAPAQGEKDSEEPQYTIGISIPDVRGPYFTAISYGFLSQAEKRGVKAILLDAGGYEFIDKQISQIEDLISRGVDGILLDPTDDKSITPMIDKAVEKGIKVVGAGVPVESDKISGDVTVDAFELGREMARYLVKALDGKGEIITLPGPSGATWSEYRYKGFLEIIEQNPEMKIVATQWSQPDRATGLNLTEDLLGRFPNAVGIYAADDAIGQGAGDALVAANKTEQVELVTAVLGPDTETMVRNGTIDATVALRLVVMGATSVDMMLDVLEGKEVEHQVFVPPLTVTKDNIDSIKMEEFRQPEGWRP